MNMLYVAAAGSWLPERMTVTEAEESGLCRSALARNTGMVSVAVSRQESAPEMAVLAARQTLAQAELSGADVDLILHACAYHQGHDMWSPASYIQRYAVDNSCLAVEVRQMSNGGMAAFELAAAYLAADPSRSAALITTADRFCEPGFDRWRTDPSTVCGDGATSIVLSNVDGFARVLSLVTVSDSGLERGGRGDRPFSTSPLGAAMPIDIGGNSACLVEELGLERLLDRIEAGQREAFETATQDADVKLDDVDWFVLPNMGRSRMKAHFFEPFGIEPEQTTWSWGRTVGHLGAGDQFGGLAHLVESEQLQPGQLVLLAGIGAGFTWTAAVLEVL